MTPDQPINAAPDLRAEPQTKAGKALFAAVKGYIAEFVRSVELEAVALTPPSATEPARLFCDECGSYDIRSSIDGAPVNSATEPAGLREAADDVLRAVGEHPTTPEGFVANDGAIIRAFAGLRAALASPEPVEGPRP